jgi:hypothetical protein
MGRNTLSQRRLAIVRKGSFDLFVDATVSSACRVANERV